MSKLKIGQARIRSARDGTTLVETAIAMALVTVMSGGLFTVGIKAQRYGEHNRVETEAASFAKERLEDMVAMGVQNLVKESCGLRNTVTNLSSQELIFVRTPRLVWHAADGSVTNTAGAVYAEAHVDITYPSPMYGHTITDTYSTLIK
ncbi:MAG: hypothetical protein QGH42_08010 [Kiritimatiellia bacterium]|jgi:hypothetical protein|nr:hypothetical protein [Kiritimatiellia bacterium]MDP6630319.1 hypothetical protein [Kiritimatiellia bacterium]MDP6810826.1 hypothetical protein [Kiritimatiellia bacterium]MDP7024168.1 hypothetical protein [Kiritimatiellia bacterium]